ncbi:unnamed protein product [Closterium sp. Naga37s-1]|nr:unnamed protein product [Closterium sp. Naga37s-1]
MSATNRTRSSATRCYRRVAPPWSMRADAAARLLICAALALSTAADCSSSANHPWRQAPRPNQRVLSPLARPIIRAQRSLLKLDAATAAAYSEPSAARPVALEASQRPRWSASPNEGAHLISPPFPPPLFERSLRICAVSAIVQVQAAWGAWAGSNDTTACSAWPGVTCSPNGLVIALDSKAVAVDGSAAIPASITNLAALQYLSVPTHPPSNLHCIALHAAQSFLFFSSAAKLVQQLGCGVICTEASLCTPHSASLLPSLLLLASPRPQGSHTRASGGAHPIPRKSLQGHSPVRAPPLLWPVQCTPLHSFSLLQPKIVMSSLLLAPSQ